MKVSVVIPCYNEAGTIEKVVEAVLGAPGPEKEIIVVDDCSTDGTREILKEKIAARVSRIQQATTETSSLIQCLGTVFPHGPNT